MRKTDFQSNKTRGGRKSGNPDYDKNITALLVIGRSSVIALSYSMDIPFLHRLCGREIGLSRRRRRD
jgi:hypothetical protein